MSIQKAPGGIPRPLAAERDDEQEEHIRLKNYYLNQVVEAASGFEPLNGSFADCSLSHLGTPPQAVRP